MSEREALAGERDRRADQREALADEREQRLDEREWRLDEQVRAITAFVDRLEAQSRDLIESSRALLAASGQNPGRRAAVKRPGRPGRPEQVVTGTTAGDKQDQVAAPAELPALIERATVLRQQLKTTLAALATTEEEVARVHDEIAARRPGSSEPYWLAASKARTRARQFRDIEDHFHD